MSNQAIERFVSKRWGVFSHYLNGMQNGDWAVRNPSGKKTTWDECVNEFDAERLAFNLKEMGAGYYCISTMQASRYMCSPNETFDRFCGTKPGEACSKRDLPMDIAKALAKYDIDLFLYISADGPWMADDIGTALSIGNPRNEVTPEFVKNWSSVMQEWSERYGRIVKGWWIDSCYTWLGFNDELLEYYHRAAKAGNPDSLVACNRTGTSVCERGLSTEEFTCGEQLNFEKMPESRDVGGAQAHLLIPLGVHPETGDCGHTWCMPGEKAAKEEVLAFMKKAVSRQIPVTFDIAVYRDGSFDPGQQEFLKYVNDRL